MAKQVMDIHPGKGGISKEQSDEHLRNWSEKKWEKIENKPCKNNYNRSRSHLNFEVLKGGKIAPLNEQNISIPARMAANLAGRNIQDPNKKKPKRPRKKGTQPMQYNTVANIIFGGSRDRMLEMAFGSSDINTIDRSVDHSALARQKDIEKWALDVYNFACRQWGEENIVGFCVHLDETNPHIHCSVMPIQNGKFCYDALFNSFKHPKLFREYHDNLAAVNEKWGLDRGDPVAVTGNRHISNMEYHHHLKKDVISLDERKEQLEKEMETLSENLNYNRMSLGGLLQEHKLAQKRCKGLKSMLKNLDEKHSNLTAKIDKLRVQGEAKGEALMEQQRLLEKVMGIIERKNVELAAADRKLELLNDKIAEMQAQLKDINRKVAESQNVFNASLIEKANINLQRIGGAALNEVLDELDSVYAKMSPQEAELFEGTLIEDLMNRAPEILKCATFLFMDFPVQASNFAIDNGGGGGGASDDSWWKKRDDDEDEQAYARRCFAEAIQLMKPPQRRKGLRR